MFITRKINMTMRIFSELLFIVLYHKLIQKESYFINSFLASGDFSRLLLITFAKCLDPDQDRQNVGPDLDPNHLTL